MASHRIGHVRQRSDERSAMRALALLGGALLALAIITRRVFGGRAHVSESAEAYRGARHRVLVLGGGFGGTTVARDLGTHFPNSHDVSILVVDRSTNMLFTPLLWTVADGRVNPNHVSVSLRGMQRNRPFHFLQADIQHIDVDRRVVTTSAGDRPYDTLVIAMGSQTSLPDLPGLKQHARRFASPQDAMELRNHLIDAIEAAHRVTDPAERAEWLTFVVAGAGDTGVELAATIHEYITNGLLAAYPWLARERPRVVLIGRNERVVPMSEPSASDAIHDALLRQGVEIMTSTSVTSATDRTVTTDKGTIAARTLYWAAGISAVPVAHDVDLEHARNGAIVVDDHLRAKNHPEIFVVGDSAWAFNANDGSSVPPTAQASESAGHYVANLIRRRIDGDLSPSKPYSFHSKGMLVVLGRDTAVAELGSHIITGLPAWAMWHGYYVATIPSWRNRVRLIVDLLASGITGRETTQLLLNPRPVPATAAPTDGRQPADDATNDRQATNANAPSPATAGAPANGQR